jgi:AcrR family transcriptional regulator
MTRAESRARTHELVLESAAVIFRRDGFHEASIDEIAEEAGFSRGAVYSRFANKDEFFLALCERETQRRVQLIVERLPVGGTLGEAARTAARTFYESHLADPSWSLLTAEFTVHAVRNPDVARRFREQDRALREASTRLIVELCAREGIACEERDANEVVTAMLAIGSGITLEQQLAPETIGVELMEDMYAAIVRRVGSGRRAPAGA